MSEFLRTLAAWLIAQPGFARTQKVRYMKVGGEVYGPDRWRVFHDPHEQRLYAVRLLGPLNDR